MPLLVWTVTTLGVVGLLALLATLARTVRRDGLGHRPPPADREHREAVRPW